MAAAKGERGPSAGRGLSWKASAPRAAAACPSPRAARATVARRVRAWSVMGAPYDGARRGRVRLLVHASAPGRERRPAPELLLADRGRASCPSHRLDPRTDQAVGRSRPAARPQTDGPTRHLADQRRRQNFHTPIHLCRTVPDGVQVNYWDGHSQWVMAGISRVVESVRLSHSVRESHGGHAPASFSDHLYESSSLDAKIRVVPVLRRGMADRSNRLPSRRAGLPRGRPPYTPGIGYDVSSCVTAPSRTTVTTSQSPFARTRRAFE